MNINRLLIYACVDMKIGRVCPTCLYSIVDSGFPLFSILLILTGYDALLERGRNGRISLVDRTSFFLNVYVVKNFKIRYDKIWA